MITDDLKVYSVNEGAVRLLITMSQVRALPGEPFSIQSFLGFPSDAPFKLNGSSSMPYHFLDPWDSLHSFTAWAFP